MRPLLPRFACPARAPAAPRRSAFTLIELLTVIAIIGILAAIIIPTVGRVRQSAKSAQCLSNLRQMGMGFTLFAADNKGRLPRVGLNPRPNKPEVVDALWYSAISPYIQKSQIVSNHPVYRCPSEETQVPADRVNSVIQYSVSRALEKSGSAVLANGVGARPEEIPSPTRTFMLVDVKVNDQGTTSNASMIYSQIQTSINGTPEASATVAYRHNLGLNCLFVDGHTARLSFDEFKERLIDPIEGRKLWDPFGKF
jgi:prepilin-type N-terminal cleavage/methylation domain-containing protein/prepilin-type processing-associated H-X9-DG protein